MRLLDGGLLLGLADLLRRELALRGYLQSRDVEIPLLHVVGRDRDAGLDGHVANRVPQLHAAFGLVRGKEDWRAVCDKTLLRKLLVPHIDLLCKSEQDEFAILREVIADGREQNAKGLSPFDLIALTVAQLLVGHVEFLNSVGTDRANLLACLQEDFANRLLQRLRLLGAGRNDSAFNRQRLGVVRIDFRRSLRASLLGLFQQGVGRDGSRLRLRAKFGRCLDGGVVLVVLQADNSHGIRLLRKKRRRHQNDRSASDQT